MNLTENPEIVTWPPTHYVYIEKTGPFQQNAPAAWKEAHGFVAKVLENNKITGYTSLYKAGPKIYRAGFSLAEAPKELPDGLAYEHFAGGKYSKFVLTGSYADLPKASGRVFELVEEKHIAVRDDFFIENYVTDPRTTPEAELKTEILVPTT